ncbi:Patatin/Phospholipase A2-related protein [Corchorus capsularis]|uniref:Patatin n=1 Tax=Corchorus capsularis TaxID=210143 RepID=A0A1R3IKH5_COCAP|nr:Patatin/Phospholipase A2-related protein [Corchorus capsularis]
MALFKEFDETLTNQIFSILENRFLFGDDENVDVNVKANVNQQKNTHQKIQLQEMKSGKHITGKVRILSIDSGSFSDGILAAQSLVRLENFLRQKSGNPNAAISHYFDVVAGSGAGGILASLLFTRGKNGAPIFTAQEALNFLVKNRRKLFPSSPGGMFRRIFGSSKVEKLLSKTFGDLTLKDTLKSVLIPCYDLSTHAPFLFSRADALEMDGYDFKMKDVCLATSADPTVVGAVEMRSVDQRTKIVAVDGGVAMNNPTAAAMTHVLNNKQEFPFCNGVEDLLVLSLGNGESDFGGAGNATPRPRSFIRIAGEGASDMVDQAVSMAFGESGKSNYVRIQGNGFIPHKTTNANELSNIIEEMLAQRNVESILFKGKKMSEVTNLEKIEKIGIELVKEQERRKTSILPTVVLKQVQLNNGSSTSPRTSSATSISTQSSC